MDLSVMLVFSDIGNAAVSSVQLACRNNQRACELGISGISDSMGYMCVRAWCNGLGTVLN